METSNATGPAGQIMQDVLQMDDERPANEPNVLRLPGSPEPEPLGVKERILQEQIIDALRTVYDPEIPVNIYELGLIYGMVVNPTGVVDIQMTLTSPACPVAESLPIEVENKIRAVPGVEDVNLELVWDPPYSPNMMSDAARLDLGFW